MEIVKKYLEDRASRDPEFAAKIANPKKSIEECEAYIIGEAFKNAEKMGNGAGSFIDDCDVFSMIVHYYDEDNIEITPLPEHVEFNGATYKPTEEDFANAKKAALERLEREAYEEIHGKKKKVTEKPKEDNNQQTLFGDETEE